ncbi:MAG TPA: hypothetical protein ENJ09_14450, partial [Planctomycetes bacterium]|nr:hypothetical protein [Planctomycetota bacterium]
MNHSLRNGAALVLLALFLVLFALFLPGGEAAGGEGSSFSLGRLLVVSFDPIPVAVGLLSLLAVWRSTKRGMGPAENSPLRRGLVAGAHAYLWASFAVSAFLLAAFFVTGGGQDSSPWIGSMRRLDLIKLGGWLAIVLVILAESLDAGEEQSHATAAISPPRGWVHALDAVSAVGLVACVAVLFLRVFTYRSPPLDSSVDWQPVGFLAPTFDAVTVPLVGWSLLLAVVLPWTLVRVTPGGRTGRGPRAGRLGLLLGALGAIV